MSLNLTITTRAPVCTTPFPGVGYQVVPGQSVYLRSGREALLVETVEDSNALVVVGTGGKANVVEETTKGKLTKLPLSLLKDFEAVAALAAGKGPPGAVSGVELVKQVWVVLCISRHPFLTGL